MKKQKTHEYRTRDTYEACYYMLRGAILLRVEWVTATQYAVVLTGVKPYSKMQWYAGTASVNAKDFAYARRDLKKQISSMPKRMWTQGDVPHEVGNITVPVVPNIGQPGFTGNTTGVRNPEPNGSHTTGEGS